MGCFVLRTTASPSETCLHLKGSVFSLPATSLKLQQQARDLFFNAKGMNTLL